METKSDKRMRKIPYINHGMYWDFIEYTYTHFMAEESKILIETMTKLKILETWKKNMK